LKSAYAEPVFDGFASRDGSASSVAHNDLRGYAVDSNDRPLLTEKGGCVDTTILICYPTQITRLARFDPRAVTNEISDLRCATANRIVSAIRRNSAMWGRRREPPLEWTDVRSDDGTVIGSYVVRAGMITVRYRGGPQTRTIVSAACDHDDLARVMLSDLPSNCRGS
jgi:hypothetical protein